MADSAEYSLLKLQGHFKDGRYETVINNLTIKVPLNLDGNIASVSISRKDSPPSHLVLIAGHTSLCRVGKASLSIHLDRDAPLDAMETDHEDNIADIVTCSDLLFTFASENDRASCLSRLSKIIGDWEGKGVKSVFDQRTDGWSAVQYFQFYSFLSQQQNMLQDFTRTATYQQAVLSNLPDFRNKVVMDVGAGSGILSFFAVQAGARKVYAVEASNMAAHCRDLVAGNGLQDKITVVSGKVEEISLDDKVDIIISEPMGYMLFNERMLESYIHSRKFLKPGGNMFPTVADLYIAPFTDEALFMEQHGKANFWFQQNFHGVDLTRLREAAVREYFRQPVVDTFDISSCLARAYCHHVDFLTAEEADLVRIDIPVTFRTTQSGTIHGLAFWFDVAFLGSQRHVWLSTAPTEPLTHWYQVRCLFETPLCVQEKEEISGNVLLVSNERQSYDVHIEMDIPGTTRKVSNCLDLKNPYFRYTFPAMQTQAAATTKTSTTTDFTSGYLGSYATNDATSETWPPVSAGSHVISPVIVSSITSSCPVQQTPPGNVAATSQRH